MKQRARRQPKSTDIFGRDSDGAEFGVGALADRRCRRRWGHFTFRDRLRACCGDRIGCKLGFGDRSRRCGDGARHLIPQTGRLRLGRGSGEGFGKAAVPVPAIRAVVFSQILGGSNRHRSLLGFRCFFGGFARLC